MIRTNLLLADNFPISIYGYINILTNQNHHYKPIDFTTAYSCEEAYLKITKRFLSQKTLNLVFLDISLPSYQSKNLYTSNDLAKLIKIYFSACKIILLTMHNEPIAITRAIQEINPKGFILEK